MKNKYIIVILVLLLFITPAKMVLAQNFSYTKIIKPFSIDTYIMLQDNNNDNDNDNDNDDNDDTDEILVPLSEPTIEKLKELVEVLEEKPDKRSFGVTSSAYVASNIGIPTTNYSLFGWGFGGDIELRWTNGPFPILSEELLNKRQKLLEYLRQLNLYDNKLKVSEIDELIYLLAETEIAEVREDLDKMSYGFTGYSLGIPISFDYISSWYALAGGLRYAYHWSGISPDMSVFHYAVGTTAKIGITIDDSFQNAAVIIKNSFDFVFNFTETIELPISVGWFLKSNFSTDTQFGVYVELFVLRIGSTKWISGE